MKNKKISIVVFPVWVAWMLYVASRSLSDVPVIYESMLELMPALHAINGDPVSESKSVKSGSALIYMEYSSAKWSQTVRDETVDLFKKIGAVEVYSEKLLRYCKNRQRYDVVPPQANGFATYRIMMAYPGSGCE